MSTETRLPLDGIFDGPLSDEALAALREGLGGPLSGGAGERISTLLHQYSVLIEVNKTLSRSLSLDELLPRLIDVITDVLHADRGTLFLYDEENDELFSHIAQGDGTGEIRIPSAAGIAGTVFTAGDTLNIPDAQADPRFNPEVDKRTGYHTRNILCVPLRNKSGERIGVTQLLNKGGGPFEPGDVALLEVITSQASAALEHAQMYERLERARRDEAALIEVSSAVSSDLDLGSLLAKVMAATTALLEAERSTLFVHDPDKNELWSRVAEGIGMKEIRFPADAGIAGECFTSAEVLSIPDAYADPRFNPEIDRKTQFRTRNILCMPLVNKIGQPIAVMQVLNKIGGPFQARDQTLLKAFTAQVSVSLENAKLFQDVLELRNYNEGILKSLSNGVVTLDKDLRITKTNDAALHILGREEEDLVDRQAETVFGNANRWILSSLGFVGRTGGSDYHADTDFLRDDATTVSVNVTVAPLQDIHDQAIGYMMVFEDITGEKRFRTTMARYLAKEVVDKVIESGEDSFLASSQEATILFSDIRRFTSISEKIGPTETVAMLNEYFTDMVDVVLRHGGLLDKYIGDAIMAVFGAPIVNPMDADNAVAVGIEMILALRSFNQRRLDDGLEPIAIGIGVSTGEVVAGSVGSTKRMDYTVIGDCVNLAARLESANKFYGTQVLIAGPTVARMKTSLAMREVDLIRVKGKIEPVAIYEPLGYYPGPERAALTSAHERYQDAVRLYRQRRWQDAAACFDQVLALCPDDVPSRLYIDRCSYYTEAPPDDDWDGVWALTQK